MKPLQTAWKGLSLIRLQTGDFKDDSNSPVCFFLNTADKMTQYLKRWVAVHKCKGNMQFKDFNMDNEIVNANRAYLPDTIWK